MSSPAFLQMSTIYEEAEEEVDRFDISQLAVKFSNERKADLETVREQTSIAEKREALGRQLHSRIGVAEFNAKFQALELKEDQFFNRSSKLSHLLSKRPASERLIANNILRPNLLTLPADSASANQGPSLGSPLAKTFNAERLSSLIAKRSDPATLRSKNIIKDDVRSGGDSSSTSDAPSSSSASSSIQSSRAALNNLLLSRPALESLVERKFLASNPLVSPANASRADDASSASASSTNQLTFKRVKFVHPVVDGNCGWSHTCILTKDGDVYATGSNENGRLGLGKPSTMLLAQRASTAASATEGGDNEDQKSSDAAPEIVDAVSSFTALPALAGKKIISLSSGDTHSAALSADGDVFVWGAGSWGRLGLGNTADVTAPTKIEGLPGPAQAVSCGTYHTIVLLKDGTVYAVGWNKNGRLGTGLTTSQSSQQENASTPSTSSSLSTLSSTSSSASASSSPSLLSPASSVSFSALSSSMTSVPLPVSFPASPSGASPSIVGICAGEASSAAWDSAGVLYMWGSGACGVTGDKNDVKDALQPRRVVALDGVHVVSVSIGSQHVLALTKDGQVYAWGAEKDSQLGTSSAASTLTPQSQTMASLPSPLSTSTSTSSSPLSTSSPSPSSLSRRIAQVSYQGPMLVSALAGIPIVSVSAGKAHSFAVSASGVLYAWGKGSRGVLGSGSEDTVSTPTAIQISTESDAATSATSSTIVGVASAWAHTVAWSKEGDVFSTGNSSFGKLG